MSNYGCHMWGGRKADAVFPFVKSSFWKAGSILMVQVQSLNGSKGERAVERRQAHPFGPDTAISDKNSEDMLVWLIGSLAVVLYVCENYCSSMSPGFKVSQCTTSVRVGAGPADTQRQYRKWGCVSWNEKPEWNDRLSCHSLQSSIAHCRQTTSITQSSRGTMTSLTPVSHAHKDRMDRTAAVTAPHVTASNRG